MLADCEETFPLRACLSLELTRPRAEEVLLKREEPKDKNEPDAVRSETRD